MNWANCPNFFRIFYLYKISMFFHLLLNTSGEINDRVPFLPDIFWCLSYLSENSRSINLTAISFFPNESSQVLAVLVQPDSHLNYLHEEIEKTAVNIGCGSELKAYRPHITLGRFKEKDRPQYEFGVFQEPLKGKVKQLDVLESEFNKGKTEYRVLESLEF